MQIVEQARAYLEQVEKLVGDVHRDVRRKLFDALPGTVKEEARRLQKASFFVPQNAVLNERVEHISPSGQYKLVVTPYRTGPSSWAYSQGLVYRREDDQPIAEIQRNYRAFPFAWLEGHPKGDFLVGGEDYQGQTVINLKTAARRDTLHGDAFKGFGFCWASLYPSPTGKLLCVSGCVWGGPYELRFYDFSDPMCPPWPEISTGRESFEFFGWVDDERANVGGYEDYYTPLNQSEAELRAARRNGEITDEDFERYRDDDDNWQERKVKECVWTCPTPLESLIDYVKDTFGWRRGRSLSASPSELSNAKTLLIRLSSDERARFDATDAKELFDWAFANPEKVVSG